MVQHVRHTFQCDEENALCLCHHGSTALCRGSSPREEAVEKKKTELEAVLAKHRLEVVENASTRVWQYYPPFAPNFLKLHEVLLPVKDV